MASTTLDITLAAPLITYVESLIKSGAYGTPSAYFCKLIRDARDRDLAQLEA